MVCVWLLSHRKSTFLISNENKRMLGRIPEISREIVTRWHYLVGSNWIFLILQPVKEKEKISSSAWCLPGLSMFCLPTCPTRVFIYLFIFPRVNPTAGFVRFRYVPLPYASRKRGNEANAVRTNPPRREVNSIGSRFWPCRWTFLSVESSFRISPSVRRSKRAGGKERQTNALSYGCLSISESTFEFLGPQSCCVILRNF